VRTAPRTSHEKRLPHKSLIQKSGKPTVWVANLRIGIVGAAIVALVLVVGATFYSPHVSQGEGNIVVAQTEFATTTPYCVYQLAFLVVKVQVSPEQTSAGTSLDIVFKVEYADGSPVVLYPELADFLVLGPTYSRTYQRVPVAPTGTPGEYRTSIGLASDIPDGTYKVYCIHCTLSDEAHNFGPNSDTSSDQTLIATDTSVFTIGAVTTTTVTTVTQPLGGPLSTAVLVGMGILALIAAVLLALLALRRPTRKKE